MFFSDFPHVAFFQLWLRVASEAMAAGLAGRCLGRRARSRRFRPMRAEAILNEWDAIRKTPNQPNSVCWQARPCKSHIIKYTSLGDCRMLRRRHSLERILTYFGAGMLGDATCPLAAKNLQFPLNELWPSTKQEAQFFSLLLCISFFHSLKAAAVTQRSQAEPRKSGHLYSPTS